MARNYKKKTSDESANRGNCPSCNGTGSLRATHAFCKGKGCNLCQGGYIWEDCGTCKGRGKL